MPPYSRLAVRALDAMFGSAWKTASRLPRGDDMKLVAEQVKFLGLSGKDNAIVIQLYMTMLARSNPTQFKRFVRGMRRKHGKTPSDVTVPSKQLRSGKTWN